MRKKAGATRMLATRWPASLLQRVLHEGRPAGLLEDLDKHERKQHLGQEQSEEERPLPCECLQRRETQKNAPDENRSDQESQERYQVPVHPDAPPEASTQQVPDAVVPARGRRYQEGWQRDAEDGGDRDYRVEGESFREVDREGQQPSSLKDRGQEDDPSNGVDHDQEGRHRTAGHRPLERRGAGGLLVVGNCGHYLSPRSVVPDGRA